MREKNSGPELCALSGKIWSPCFVFSAFIRISSRLMLSLMLIWALNDSTLWQKVSFIFSKDMIFAFGNFLMSFDNVPSFSVSFIAQVAYIMKPFVLRSLKALESRAHCSVAMFFILDGVHCARYLSSLYTCLSLEHGASRSIASNDSVSLVHQVAASEQLVVILDLMFSGRQVSTTFESRDFLCADFSFENSFASSFIDKAIARVFPPGAAHRSATFSTFSSGRHSAAQRLAASR